MITNDNREALLGLLPEVKSDASSGSSENRKRKKKLKKRETFFEYIQSHFQFCALLILLGLGLVTGHRIQVMISNVQSRVSHIENLERETMKVLNSIDRALGVEAERRNIEREEIKAYKMDIDMAESHSSDDPEIDKQKHEKDFEGGTSNSIDLKNAIIQQQEQPEILETHDSVQITPTKENSTTIRPQVNVASFVNGASVDTRLSSSSSLTPFAGINRAGYVILDRPYLSESRAWCSYDKEPILTINLANYSKPTAVSYQHADWEGVVPEDAPKEYDVYACLDSECEDIVLIAANCQYLPSEDESGPEQNCSINENNGYITDKIQFRFRSNHGKIKHTCVHLVRVYADENRDRVLTRKEIKQNEKLKRENEKECSALAGVYYGDSLKKFFIDSECVSLYSKNCCSVCPECCEKCTIGETFWVKVGSLFWAVFVIAMFFVLLIVFALICMILLSPEIKQ